jgi:PAS domain S-box-containing protein
MTRRGRPRGDEQHFRLLVEGVVDYAIYMLDPNGIVTNWNVGGQRIKGYLPEEIIGQHFSIFYTDVDRAAGKPQRALEIARTTGHFDDEALRVRKDGSYFWASVVIDPIYTDDGELLGFAKITRDVTERHEARQQVEKIQRQLAESQKFDALGQLTGGVAHDFNNLLMIISGNIQLLKGAATTERQQRAVAAIETAAARGATLTSQLLTFARRQRVNPEPINVRDRIHAVRDVLDIGVGKSIELQIEIEDDISAVVVDAVEFETALVNLVVNARDAMPNGGRILISAKNIAVAEGPFDGPHVAITVEDNGTGIPPDVVAKVFDPFFTTKPIGKGTGLGLSQVHGFAHQAGGTVTLKSELGKGTDITICLPKGRLAGGQVDEADDALANATVLLVEDNPDVASITADMLAQLGFAVCSVSDAQSALKEVERHGADIDIIFSDIVMPGTLDGLGLAQHLKQSNPDLPILLATGYSDALLQVGSQFPVLRKPYQLHELGQALAKLPRWRRAPQIQTEAVTGP